MSHLFAPASLELQPPIVGSQGWDGMAAACSAPEMLVGSLSAIELFSSVQAGFPSPAEDFTGKRIDVLDKLVRHPQATYAMRVRGESMREAGIFDGDVLLVDRAIKPAHGMVVVAVVDGEFTCKQLSLRAGRLKLKAANPTFADIVPKEGQTVEVWGVVIASIKKFAA